MAQGAAVAVTIEAVDPISWNIVVVAAGVKLKVSCWEGKTRN